MKKYCFTRINRVICVNAVRSVTNSSCPVSDSLRVRSTSGAVTSEKFGTKRRKKFITPKTERRSLTQMGVERRSLTQMGVGSSWIALMRSFRTASPSAEITWPKYATDLGPNASLDGFRVRPVACNVANMPSKYFERFSQVADKTQKSSIYMSKSGMCPNVLWTIYVKSHGALQTPDGIRL